MVGDEIGNLMMFGTGANGKYHRDSLWEDGAVQSPLERIEQYVPYLLNDASSFRKLVVSVNLFLWDAMASKQYDDFDRFNDGAYQELIYQTMKLLQNISSRIGHPHLHVSWRTAPHNLIFDPTNTSRVNSIQRLAACASGMRLVDWAREGNVKASTGMLIDLVHWKDYSRFWAMYQSIPIGDDPCSHLHVDYL